LITRPEVTRALTGALRLFIGKPDALRFFDTSTDGFWKSFQAIVLVAPIYAMTAFADRTAAFADAIALGTISEGAFWAAKAVTLAIDWVALPILLAALAGPIGIKRAYPVYIVVRNWATPVMTLPFAVLAVLQSAGVLEGDVLVIASLAALAYALRFSYVIARKTLDVAMDVAVGLVALDFLLSLALALSIGRLTGIEFFD
jgi:hypothetical protein